MDVIPYLAIPIVGSFADSKYYALLFLYFGVLALVIVVNLIAMIWTDILNHKYKNYQKASDEKN